MNSPLYFNLCSGVAGFCKSFRVWGQETRLSCQKKKNHTKRQKQLQSTRCNLKYRSKHSVETANHRCSDPLSAHDAVLPPCGTTRFHNRGQLLSFNSFENTEPHSADLPRTDSIHRACKHLYS